MEKRKRDSLNSITECHLRNMKLASTNQINEWFKQSYAGKYWISLIEEAAALLLRFVDKTVCIFGDYDCDGIMATAIMVRALRWKGFKDVRYRIPHRFSEGYGLNRAMIDEIDLPADQVLIFTVDNGIAALDAIEYAKSKGFSVVVTDHHLPAMEDGTTLLPDADLIIDPNAIAGTAAYTGYCGAGIAYKVADALLSAENPGAVKILQPYAMLATLCDQMQLTEENYVFVRNGLEKVRRGNCLPGLSALTEILGVQHWEADTALFHAGPCINALERMCNDSAKTGVQLMLCDDIDECRKIASTLKQVNEARKASVASAMDDIENQIGAMPEPGYPLVVYVPGVSEGIIGIIAGRIKDAYGIPTGIFTDGEVGCLKGSFRSDGQYDIKAHLDMCADTMLQFGGHPEAAGVVVEKDRFDAFRDALKKVSGQDKAQKTEEILLFDVEIKAKDIEKAIEENERFAPFGNGNEDLVYKVTDFEVIPDYGAYRTEMRGNSVRLKSEYCKAVGFGLWDATNEINAPCTLNVFGKIKWDHYNGKRYPTIQMIDLEVGKKRQNLSPIAARLSAVAKSR